MYACPWCERKTFSFWQKQSLGPHKTLRCTGCKRQVGVPWARANLAALPVFLCAVAGLYFVGDASVGMMLMMPIYHRFVPLVKPENR